MQAAAEQAVVWATIYNAGGQFDSITSGPAQCTAYVHPCCDIMHISATVHLLPKCYGDDFARVYMQHNIVA